MSFSPSLILALLSIIFSLLVGTTEGYISHDFRHPSIYRTHRPLSLNTTSPLAITGIPFAGTESIVQRPDIRPLPKNTLQWNLYLLALSNLQAMDQVK